EEDEEDLVREGSRARGRGSAVLGAGAWVGAGLFGTPPTRCRAPWGGGGRRPAMPAAPPPGLPEPTSSSEVIWLQPYPDVLLEELPEPAPGPEAQYEAKEAISLAFVTALQLLPPHQRAVLVLRDVLGFHSREVAAMLDSSEDSVSSALKHARANLRRRLPSPADPPPAPGSAVERAVVERLTRAYETGDVDAVVALLTDDVVLTAPLAPVTYEGRPAAGRFLRSGPFRDGRTSRLIATRANGQPAFGVYVHDPVTGVAHANGMLVLTLAGRRIRAVTGFDNSVLPLFGLPRTLPGRG